MWGMKDGGGGAWRPAPDLGRLTDSLALLYSSASPISASSVELYKVEVEFGRLIHSDLRTLLR